MRVSTSECVCECVYVIACEWVCVCVYKCVRVSKRVKRQFMETNTKEEDPPLILSLTSLFLVSQNLQQQQKIG